MRTVARATVEDSDGVVGKIKLEAGKVEDGRQAPSIAGPLAPLR